MPPTRRKELQFDATWGSCGDLGGILGRSRGFWVGVGGSGRRSDGRFEAGVGGLKAGVGGFLAHGCALTAKGNKMELQGRQAAKRKPKGANREPKVCPGAPRATSKWARNGKTSEKLKKKSRVLTFERMAFLITVTGTFGEYDIRNFAYSI